MFFAQVSNSIDIARLLLSTVLQSTAKQVGCFKFQHHSNAWVNAIRLVAVVIQFVFFTAAHDSDAIQQGIISSFK
jgi:hypothetical protein